MKARIASIVFCTTMFLGIGSAFADTTSPNYVEWPDWFEGTHAPTTAAATVAPNYVEWPDWFEGIQAPTPAATTATAFAPKYVEWPDWFE